MAKIQFCPRCGQKTDASVCPICFTRLDVQQRRALNADEAASLPPFTCPRCGSKELLTDGVRYFCGVCGIALQTPPPIPRPRKINFDPMTGERLIDPVTENPDYIENPLSKEPKEDPGQTVFFTPPVKEKRGLTRGGLVAILCGIVLLFAIGGGIAIAANGIEKTKDSWKDVLEESFEGFGEDFFSDIPGFEDYFGGIDPFEEYFGGNDPFAEESAPNDDPFTDKAETPDTAFDWQSDKEIAEENYYPNGCSEVEYHALKNGMNYAQISAIIGGDAGNWYETTDAGEECTVFQWVTEDSRGVVMVKMVDGKAQEFHVEAYPEN